MNSRFSFSNILLPVDFSKKSIEMARYAAQFAKATHARITLLHVLPQHYGFDMPGFEDEALAHFLREDENKAQRQLNNFLKAGFRDLNVRRVFVKGDPAEQIVRYAHSEKFDLIIMSTHGHGLFRRKLLGSVTAKVLHDVKTPVLTSVHIEKAGTAKSMLPCRIVCALDLGPESTRPLRWASALASTVNGSMTAVHVIPSFEFPGEGYGPPAWSRLAKEEPTRALSKLLSKASVKAQIHLEAGTVPEALASAVAKLRANLVVIGRGPATGNGGSLPTNAYAIVRSSPCPVVSV
jgi:nucleotide-binding universal stress UspA family protein